MMKLGKITFAILAVLMLGLVSAVSATSADYTIATVKVNDKVLVKMMLMTS